MSPPGPALAMEKLAEDGFDVARETLRAWLIEEKLWQPRRKRVKCAYVKNEDLTPASPGIKSGPRACRPQETSLTKPMLPGRASV